MKIYLFKSNTEIVVVTLQDVSSTRADHPCYVFVTDVNDELPDFQFALSDDNYIEFELNEGNYTGITTPGQYIGRVEAKDADGTEPNNVVSVKL